MDVQRRRQESTYRWCSGRMLAYKGALQGNLRVLAVNSCGFGRVYEGVAIVATRKILTTTTTEVRWPGPFPRERRKGLPVH